MRGEIAGMGARTPHELMRCAEVTFIRDCAEMAARASLARTECRWGLYHERLDHPSATTRVVPPPRPVQVRVWGRWSSPPVPWRPIWCRWTASRRWAACPGTLGEVLPEQVAVAGTREAAPAARIGPGRAGGAPDGTATGEATAGAAGAAHEEAGRGAERDTAREAQDSPDASVRLLALLTLAEQEPELPQLRTYLADPDPAIRRAAVVTLTETAPQGTGPALAGALTDPDAGVRAAAAASLRELVETLPPEPALYTSLVGALSAADALVRATALDVLRALRLGDADLFARAFDDPDTTVRIAAVRALVSVDAADQIAHAATDPSREVRVTAAKALASIASSAAVTDAPRPGTAALGRLVEDPDALVRGAAFEALAAVDCPPHLAAAAVHALADQAWQVRSGAAKALGAADPELAVPALASALDDTNADVRKAAVLALLRHAAHSDDDAAGTAAEAHRTGTTDGRGMADGTSTAAGTGTIRRTGRAAQAARTALAAAVTDPDADVRAFAARARA